MKSTNRAPWTEILSRPADRAHLVQLYQDPAVLRESVGHFLSAGFRRGEPAAVVATKEHLGEFRKELEERGCDPSRLEKEGRLVVRDARTTLDSFMLRGMPDDVLFHRAFEPTVSSLSAKGAPGFRAYGEMVSLLWGDRQFEAAVRLEELWNGLAESRNFTLLCGYEGEALAPEFHGRPAESIYLQHTHVVPTEDYGRLSRAVQEAMEEVLGKAETAALRPLIAATRRRTSILPGAQSALLWLQSNLPDHVKAVLAAARRRTADRQRD